MEVRLAGAGAEEFIVRGLLARAALRRLRGDLPAAEADLSEALEIAERGSMRLHECDAHLEWARLCLFQRNDPEAARPHVEKARKLVNESGYGRREREVKYLEGRLAALPPQPRKEPMKDFFVSFNKADRSWADWIAWTLEEASFEVVYQPWDFRPGENFVLEMQKAATGTRKTLIVLSDSYLNAVYTQPEWAAAFAEDPQGENRKLIPLRVAQCSPTGMLKPLIYADLVGLSADEAKAAVLTAVSDGRPKPAQRPAFPGRTRDDGEREQKGNQAGPPSKPPRTLPRRTREVREQPAAPFPGAPASVERIGRGGALAVWREKLDFLLEQEPLVVLPEQKFALSKQIEEARRRSRSLAGELLESSD